MQRWGRYKKQFNRITTTLQYKKRLDKVQCNDIKHIEKQR